MISTRRGFLTLKSMLPAAGPKPASTLGEDPGPVPSLAVHAANRLMFGPSPGDVARIDTMGYDAFLAEQLNPDSIDDSAADQRIAALNLVSPTETPAQLYDRVSLSYTDSRLPIAETRDLTWTRIIYSKRQLKERVVDFWHNHFNINGWGYLIRSLWTDWDQLIRTHAMGNFRAFLEATAQHPCMLYYLDNYTSTRSGPNENYAREIFELHTLGAQNYQTPGGYIDGDVFEASRALTGWTIDRDSGSPTRGQFRYDDADHDPFIKFVLGNMIPDHQPPLKDGRDVLDLIAYHPGTASHIARKLAVRFIGPTHSEAIVTSAAQVFMDNSRANDQIALTIGHLLASDEFKAARMTKFKRPIDWVASAMRAMGMDYTIASSFTWIYDPMGMPMFAWTTPDGPPEESTAWATSNGLLQRWNWAFRIASGWFADDGLTIPAAGILPPEVNTPPGIAQVWSDRVMQRPVSTRTRDSLTEFVADGRSWNLPLGAGQLESKNRYIGAVCAMSPEFMHH